MMELKQLTESTMELFEVKEPSQLGDAILKACDSLKKLQGFKNLVNGDLETDWLQKIYQYYLADRDEKKQDFTPSSLAEFIGMLAGESEHIVDLCAGSGALIIQKWKQNKNVSFTAMELDENVIPFLLFNLVLRNIKCTVFQTDALVQDEFAGVWEVAKGEEFGRITYIKSSV
jgi:type I restriction enzyme M protein